MQNLLDNPIKIKALNKYTGNNRYLLQYDNIKIIFGYGVANSKKEYDMLCGICKKRKRKKHTPYGWTNKEVKYFKKFYYTE